MEVSMSEVPRSLVIRVQVGPELKADSSCCRGYLKLRQSRREQKSTSSSDVYRQEQYEKR
jgi:hypothetical protein